MMINQPAIPAPVECCQTLKCSAGSQRRLGFNDPYWDMTDDEMLMEFYDWDRLP